jgi:two-component system LytT family sensor kinase
MVLSFDSIVQRVYASRNWHFWLIQVAGWIGYSLVTFLSITLVDNNVSWPHIGHLTLSSALGLLVTWPLRPLYRSSFYLPMGRRITLAVIALVILSAVWTVLRILVFAWILGEEAIWKEVNYWYFGSLFVFISWSGLYFGIKYYQLLKLEHEKLLEESALMKEERIKRLQAEALARDAQLEKLRYQLNPHFLFNTLNSINALVKLGENDNAQKMIVLLSRFLRHSLDQGNLTKITLEQELATLMLYLDIEMVRFEDRLKLNFDVEPITLHALVPGLILQPLIENSMKYAIAISESGGTISLTAAKEGKVLCLEVTDSGPGMVDGDLSKPPTEGRGVGLKNVIERLATLYEDRCSFETVPAEPTGLTIRIQIPFEVGDFN